jgi:hypothetical protein
MPSRFSSRCTALLIAEGVVPNSVAAAVKLLAFAAAQNSSTVFSLILKSLI